VLFDENIFANQLIMALMYPRQAATHLFDTAEHFLPQLKSRIPADIGCFWSYNRQNTLADHSHWLGTGRWMEEAVDREYKMSLPFRLCRKDENVIHWEM
jgi:hypothetical protein